MTTEKIQMRFICLFFSFPFASCNFIPYEKLARSITAIATNATSITSGHG